MAKRSRYEERAEAFEFGMHRHGNPAIERSVPKPTTADGGPTEIEHDGHRWLVPTGLAAGRAVIAIHRGADAAAILAEVEAKKLGPVRVEQ